MYDGIEVLDNVMITPNKETPLVVREYAGQIATVYERSGSDILIVLDKGIRLCVSRSDISRVD